MSNPESRTEHVLSSGGKLIKRTITESEREITADMLKMLSEQSVIHLPALYHEPNPSQGKVMLSLWQTGCAVYRNLPKIRIRTNYSLIDGMLVPAFNRPDEPMFDMMWTPPSGMTLMFIGDCEIFDNYVNHRGAFLLAFDPDKRCYRLPIGNIYNTGALCLGDDPVEGAGAVGLFKNAFEKFDKAPWNSDLMEDGDNAKVRGLFRFQVEGESFKQLAPAKPWKELCDVIAPPILDFIKY